MLAVVMLVLSVLVIGLGVMLMDAAVTSINELAGLLVVLCGTVLFCGACIVDELRRLRRDMGKYITKAVRTIQKDLSESSAHSDKHGPESPKTN